MKKLFVILIVLFCNVAQADSAFDNFIEGIIKTSAGVRETAADTVEITQHTVIKGVSAVEALSGEVHQRLWSELQDAHNTVVWKIGRLQNRVDYIQNKLNSHIFKNKQEHDRLQAQINTLKADIAKLKKAK